MNGLEICPNVISKKSCQKIIEMFNNDKRKSRGKNVGGFTSNKKSTDLSPTFNVNDWEKYNSLIVPGIFEMSSHIKNKYSFLDEGEYWRLTSKWNIQHYSEGQGYFVLHCEHGCDYPLRIMAWMIYLNDAKCGTEYPYQDTVVEAEQGKGVIWSAGWTHPHKGVTPNIGNKYIATGWFEYYDPDSCKYVI
jgi:hypothetical protein